ncbi:glycosyltransferase family 2 protein, partial [Methylobacterium sp. WL8]|uniref:glycosyltransferase family 2 protein n=1 Tax=Methylobacterium sp. WL8 TaxID=2603899 RepID=UPI0011C91922
GRLGYFDSDWYLNEYTDINFSDIKPVDHFIIYGQHEGRHPSFDEDWYTSQYLNTASKTGNAIEHYRNIGAKEGRHAAFDRNFYLREYPEIKAAGLNPLQHYINYGIFEGRYPAFNRKWYLKAYRDVNHDNLDPYKHYIAIGNKQGRPLSPSSLSKLSSFGEPNIWGDASVATNLNGRIPDANDEFLPKVSIIVPNFNHAPYLNERLKSIYDQTYKNFEVILLDDCSYDESAKILTKFANTHKNNTRLFINKKNSGGVFNQWKKGFSLAIGELIWIAESDDYCSSDFLSELVKFFRNNAVRMAFCRTDFVQSDTRQKVWTSEEYWRE